MNNSSSNPLLAYADSSDAYRFSTRNRLTLKALGALGLASFFPCFQYAQEGVAEDEIFELSPFEVNSSSDDGYVATNTMAGSRLNTPLKDTPASITEMTAQFLDDINATTVMEAMEYTVGFSDAVAVNGTANNGQFNDANITSRAIPGTGSSRSVSRNYFVWYLNSDNYNTERLSLSRGPNAVLFGLGDPGGVINSTTKRAFFETETNVGISLDSEGSVRTTLDHNQKVNDKLAFRVNVLSEEAETWRDFEYKDQLRYHLAATFKPLEGTTIRAEYDSGDVDQLNARPWFALDRVTPYREAGSPSYDRTQDGNSYPDGLVSVSNAGAYLVLDAETNEFMNWSRFATTDRVSASNDKLTDFTGLDKSWNLNGPAATTDFDFETYSAFWEQKILKNLYLEVAYNRQDLGRDIRIPINWNELALRVDPNLTLPDGSDNPHYGDYYVEGRAQRTVQERSAENSRAGFAYELDTDSDVLGRHRILAFTSNEKFFNRNDVYAESNLTPVLGVQNLGQVPNRIYRRYYLDFENGPYAVDGDPWSDTSSTYDVTINGSTRTVTPGFYLFRQRPQTMDIDSAMLAGQSYFMESEKLAITWGARRDWAKTASFVENRDGTTGAVTSGVLSEPVSYEQDSLNYGVLYDVNKWLSVFASHSENFTPQTAYNIFEELIGNNIAEGEDFGIKISSLDNRYFGSFSYFKTSSQNRSRFGNTISDAKVAITNIWDTLAEVDEKYASSQIENNFNGSIDYVSEGYEFELTANPTKAIRLTANLGITKAITSNANPALKRYVEENLDLWSSFSDLPITLDNGQTVGDRIDFVQTQVQLDRNEEGNKALNVREYVFNTFANYTFQSDALKGFSVGGGARYRGDVILGYSLDGAALEGPDYWLFDLRFGYRKKIMNDDVLMRIALNIQNAANNQDLIYNATRTDGVYSSYSFQSPREATLRIDFEF